MAVHCGRLEKRRLHDRECVHVMKVVWWASSDTFTARGLRQLHA